MVEDRLSREQHAAEVRTTQTAARAASRLPDQGVEVPSVRAGGWQQVGKGDAAADAARDLEGRHRRQLRDW